jgi:hypothetical protein
MTDTITITVSRPFWSEIMTLECENWSPNPVDPPDYCRRRGAFKTCWESARVRKRDAVVTLDRTAVEYALDENGALGWDYLWYDNIEPHAFGRYGYDPEALAENNRLRGCIKSARRVQRELRAWLDNHD